MNRDLCVRESAVCTVEIGEYDGFRQQPYTNMPTAKPR